MKPTLSRRNVMIGLIGSAALGGARAREALPIFDAHIHYSHDAVALVAPAQAAQILRAAGLRGALVSSSDDRGTQLLLERRPRRRGGDEDAPSRSPAPPLRRIQGALAA